MWSMLLMAAILGDPAANSVKGHLVVVGGGNTTNEIVNRTLELAGGKTARIVILSEANPEYGPGSLAQWKRTEAAKVTLISARQALDAVKQIREADLIWMSGGLQGVFMNAIDGTGIAEAIRTRYREGAVVGGTSAGAAVISRKMIGGRSDLDSLKAGTAPFLMDGLGLWPEVIIDQHFLQKGRFNRLALAVLEFPNLVGVGIDEETAVIVHGHSFDVVGNGNVTIVDARKATHEKLVKDEPAAVRNMRLHVLRSGMKFSFTE